MRNSNRRGATRIFLGASLLLGAASAQAVDFSVAPDISGGLGHYSWNIAFGGAGGVANPDLTLYKGLTYTFQISTYPDYPFWIKTAPSTGTADAYAGTGLSANGITSFTTITFSVPADAPDTLYYNCGVHSTMAGTIEVVVFRNGFD